MTVKDRIRHFNKYVTNRILGNLARAPLGPFAFVRHVGRRSGKHYQTPIVVQPVAGGFVIALTYGTEVDWYRNVVAAGGCEIYWHRKDYVIDHIEPMTAQAAFAAFPAPEKAILRLVGMKNFIRLDTAKSAPAQA